LLTGVSGIGPKLGLSVLSALSVVDLFSAIQAGDVDKLATVPGIGKKSAGRIALELKDKVARLHPTADRPLPGGDGPADPLYEDALSALVNLGYRAPDVKDVLKRLPKGADQTDNLKDVIREALKHLARG
jgi:Holliday junction DNA helicase RuvA